MYTPNCQKNKRIFVYIGLLLMIVPIFTYNTVFFYPFPGLMALPPCLGAILYISGGTGLSEESFITKIFKCKFLIFIGLISYSLYLWHWPFIVFYKNFYLVNEISTTAAIGGIIVCILLSCFTWKFIEMPFRNKAIFHKNKVIYPLAICSIVLCITLTDSVRKPFHTGTFYLDNMDLTNLEISKETLEEMWARQTNDFALIGDSHSTMWSKVIDNFSNEYNLTYLKSDVAPQNTIMGTMGKRNQDDMSHWDNFTQLVKKQSIHTVFWSYRWPYRTNGREEDGKDRHKELVYENGNIKLAFVPGLLAGLRDSIRTLQDIGVKNIYIMNPVPEPYFFAPQVGSKLKQRNFKLNDINRYVGESVADYQTRTGEFQKIFLQLEAEFPSVHILDISPLLLDKEINHYRAVTEKFPYYFDDDHLSQIGAETLKEVFFPAFEKMNKYKMTQQK